MTTYALVTAIEGNGETLNSLKGIKSENPRRYEDEAIECFTAWRKNAGWLKDIAIYAYCPTKNTVSEETQQKLKELNVTYIEEYQPVVESFTSGFLVVPLIMSKAEKELKETVLIHIDLDMNIIKPLPATLVDQILDTKAVICGQYDDYCTKNQRSVKEGWSNPFDTGFTISRRDSLFYNLYFLEVLRTMRSHDPDWEKVKAVTGEYFLEEYVMDKIHNRKLWEVIPIQRYQIGEWYTPVSELSDEDLKTVYFWHEHLDHDSGYDKVREKIEYFKRTKQ